MSVISTPWQFKRGGYVVAQWCEDGSLRLGMHDLLAEDAYLLAQWIAAGPPKKRYKITRTFEEKPEAVEWGIRVARCGEILADADITEVYE